MQAVVLCLPLLQNNLSSHYAEAFNVATRHFVEAAEKLDVYCLAIGRRM